MSPGVLALVTGAVLLVAVVGRALRSWTRRRLLLSRWRRLTRWEFWPMWAFYPPVVAYVLWLAVRHRSLRLVTCVNPGIPGGGLAGESKYDILRSLSGAQAFVARTRLVRGALPLAERVAEAQAARASIGVGYPVVLKPDIGERGDGVAVVRSDQELEAYLSRAGGDALVQEYVPGIEVGVFYYRLPGEARGRIFAITEKRFPSVTGDGRRTLEELILGDDRAVCMAPTFLRTHAARLGEIPAPAAVIPLVELGTHCRGAAFHDGAWMWTPELEAAIDRLSAGFDGFWFGRYDIRAPSVEALQRGHAFTVLELNGATSEATSIYDPENGLWSAYRTLWRQWELLFEIAARNRRAGAEPLTLAEIRGLLQRHRRAREAHAQA